MTNKTVEENFCCEEHKNLYQHYAPLAHKAAEVDYKNKFYSEMNVLRSKNEKEPWKPESDKTDATSKGVK